MSNREPAHARLVHLIQRVVDREDQHLLAVRQRLLGDDCIVNVARLTRLLEDDVGIDRLESFGAKFARMQDTVVDKLAPVILEKAGEQVSAGIDNLARMERFGLVSSTDNWLEMRDLRNRLVPEYIDRPEDLAPALERACGFTDRMHTDYTKMREYAVSRFGVQPADEKR